MRYILIASPYEEDQKKLYAPILRAVALLVLPDIGVESMVWKLNGLVLVATLLL